MDLPDPWVKRHRGAGQGGAQLTSQDATINSSRRGRGGEGPEWSIMPAGRPALQRRGPGGYIWPGILFKQNALAWPLVTASPESSRSSKQQVTCDVRQLTRGSNKPVRSPTKRLP
jgi:hypothetical protein